MKKITTIGFIGLGMMGKYMAVNLLKHKYTIIGYNRSKTVLRALQKKGLFVAESPKHVAEQSDVVILMLPTAKETHDVIFDKNGLMHGLRKGHIVIDMSTSNPIETTKIMKRLKKQGVTMLDAPVSRGQKAAINGTLSIMVGGDKKAFQACLPIFKAMGTFIVHLGNFGAGQYVKALNNFTFAMNLVSATQGLRLMQKHNIDIKKAIAVISESSGRNQAMSSSINRNLDKKNPSIGFFLKYMAKDVKIFNDIMTAQRLNHILAQPITTFLKQMAKGHGDKDVMYIFEHVVANKK